MQVFHKVCGALAAAMAVSCLAIGFVVGFVFFGVCTLFLLAPAG